MTDLTLDEYRDLPGEQLEQRLKREAGIICGGSDGHENGRAVTVSGKKAGLLYDFFRVLKRGFSAIRPGKGLKESDAC